MTIDADNETNELVNGTDVMREAVRALMGKGFGPVAPQKAARKQREKQVRSTVDGRTLRAKGRTAQLNVKVAPEIKQAVSEHCEREGVSVADWMESALRAALGLKGA
jgi:hypothetical protein